MTQALDALTAQMLDAAKAAGADNADAMATRGTSLSVGVRDGALEEAQREEGADIGLRVFVGQRSAIVSASDLSSCTISEMAERAVAMAREAPENPFAGLAEAAQIATQWDAATLELFDPAPEPEPQALQQDAAEAEAAARAVTGIIKIDAASAGYSAYDIHMAGSNGFSGGYRRSSRGLSCVAIAGSGTQMERDYDSDSRVFQSDLRSATEIGRTAAERTLERRDPRKPPTGTYPVLFDERVAGSLIGHLLGAINGSAITRGASFLRDSMDQQVLPEGLSLIEDPHRPRLGSSRPFDAEFLPTAKRTIVEDGHLRSWTLDLATGRQLGLASTASAGRGVSSAPSPSTASIALTQGAQSRSDLIRDMGTGLLVTSMIGSTINPNTGDYSRGAAGLWVENGEVTYAVNECTIAGNLRDMLMAIVPANDARPHVSRVIPSLLVQAMTIAGS
jgi:PmbA protein